MPTYVSPASYRDEMLQVSGRYTQLAAGGSVGLGITLHTIILPTDASVQSLDWYMYVSLPEGGALRISLFNKSVDVYKTGVVKFQFTSSDLPSGISSYFGTQAYYLATCTFTNIGSSTLRFSVPYHIGFWKYSSSNAPAPVYYGANPEGTPGNYIDRYVIAGYSLWDTRFNYRGIRTAFPFFTVTQCVSQSVASLLVQMLRASASSGNLSSMFREYMRWQRLSRQDGVYQDAWGVMI